MRTKSKGSENSEPFIFNSREQLHLSEVFDCSYHLAGVGVLVVIPGYYLYLIGIVVNLCNHCLSCVKERNVGDTDNIG